MRFLIIRNIFKIHIFFYFIMFICLFTGNIIDFLIFTCIIIVHELGHIVGGLLFSWKIEKIILLPFGGLTIFNNNINTSLFEQFIVTILGPLFQVIFYFIFSSLFDISSSVTYFNFVLLFFNLLPICPLDGSKFLYIVLCLFFPFKVAHFLFVLVSFVCIFVIFFFFCHFDLVILLILLFLFFKVMCEFRNHHLIFYRFLFERYSYKFHFKHVKMVNSTNEMYLWCRHLFFVDNNYVTEKKFLSKLFDK